MALCSYIKVVAGVVALCNKLEMDGRRTNKPNNKY